MSDKERNLIRKKVTPVPQLLSRQCYNRIRFITAGEKHFKSLILDISQIFSGIFHLNFLIFSPLDH